MIAKEKKINDLVSEGYSFCFKCKHFERETWVCKSPKSIEINFITGEALCSDCHEVNKNGKCSYFEKK